MSNTTSPLVSVIIPAYNIESYLSQTIESVIHQSYKNIEIIIVNDGSIDTTEEIIQAYAHIDKRIIMINQSNKGLSAARNAGFKIAQGEYFCIIDADDIMLPEKIATQLTFLEHNASSDVTYSKVYYFSDSTFDIYTRNLATPDSLQVYKKLLQNGNFISPNSVFFRRSVFDTMGGFDEQLYSSEDFDYWLLLSFKGVHFLHQDSYLTLCRMRKNSMTSNGVRMYSTVIDVFKKYFAYTKYPVWKKMTSYQYIKNSLLLSISRLRQPPAKHKASHTDVLGAPHHTFLNISYYVNSIFMVLKKIKFLMTFKKVYNKDLERYLTMIELHKNI
jgi:glycosyltransferase involved in cell wall biosynthesis